MNPFIDPDTLTVGELATFEEFTGFTISETIDALHSSLQTESATFLVACLFVSGRRANPELTIEQAAALPFVTFALTDDGGDG